ncbi:MULTISPECIES: energy transducer TonB [Vibrio]|uniref:energy transducer TonB n=1 Tax=Vibrio sp. St2 TaxID=2853441 RepID=UPI00148BB4D1|nr:MULTISPECIES: energy transducer TonB [Vibrio]WFB50945.1 energy transducer TonB [Vibrio coralliilyticus]
MVVNLKRYAIAGGVSLALHTAILFVADEPKLHAMPAGAQSSTVSINFKAVPTPQPPAEPEPVAEQPVEAPEPPKPVEPAKVEPPVKKPVVKEKPVVKKEAPKQQKKVVEKKTDRPVKKTTQKKPQDQPVAKKTVEKPEKKKEVVEQTKPQPAEVNQGVSQEPVLVNRPSFLSKPTRPVYPRLAQKRKLEGVAMYEVWLDENGDQVRQILISSSGATILDNSALKAIKKWKFSPHIVNGQKMAHRVRLPVRFKLD